MNKAPFFIALSVTASLTYAAEAPPWSYTGHTGPEHWGGLDSAFTLCETGKNQAPIDITESVDAELPPLQIDYTHNAAEILNNGHTVQTNFPAGSSIRVGGREYALKQIHFHIPSENRIDGRSFPLEGHFVHADAEGNLAVVAVMFEDGPENSTLTALWSQMPMHAEERRPLKPTVAATGLLPAERDYYRFSGSLTTPPCSEGVAWHVLKTPLTASKMQIEKFAQAVHGHNNRPIQPLNARTVLQ